MLTLKTCLSAILFLFGIWPVTDLQALNLDLTVKLVRDKTLSLVLSPGQDASSCTYTILGSTSQGRLKRANPVGTNVGSFSGQDKPTTLRAQGLRKLQRPRGTRSNARAFYFLGQAQCGAENSRSNIAKISVKFTSSRPLKSDKAWLSDLRKKLTVANLSLVEAFPGLSTFHLPVDLRNAGDNSDRLFVVEQSGKIIVISNVSTNPTKSEFIDLSSVITQGSDLGERGLLGLAFHPNFKNNGFFYVNYTAAGDGHTVVARYHVNSGTPNQADSTSAQIILTQSQPFENHNGGSLAFGSDGFLYIGFGDGGSGGDPQGNGQDKRTFLGKILRIDVDHPAGGLNYSSPSTNPFFGNGLGFKQEIFAYGFRNPWRFSFDSGTGKFWAGDVGQDAREEVDIVENGKNYGWKTMEGTQCYPANSSCSTSGLTLPVTDYPHSLGEAVTGGYVYRGAAIPGLAGKYIYGDFISGRIWSLSYDGSSAFVSQLFDTDLNISAFGVDEAKELYVVSYGDGKLYLIKSS